MGKEENLLLFDVVLCSVVATKIVEVVCDSSKAVKLRPLDKSASSGNSSQSCYCHLADSDGTSKRAARLKFVAIERFDNSLPDLKGAMQSMAFVFAPVLGDLPAIESKGRVKAGFSDQLSELGRRVGEVRARVKQVTASSTAMFYCPILAGGSYE